MMQQAREARKREEAEGRNGPHALRTGRAHRHSDAPIPAGRLRLREPARTAVDTRDRRSPPTHGDRQPEAARARQRQPATASTSLRQPAPASTSQYQPAPGANWAAYSLGRARSHLGPQQQQSQYSQHSQHSQQRQPPGRLRIPTTRPTHPCTLLHLLCKLYKLCTHWGRGACSAWAPAGRDWPRSACFAAALARALPDAAANDYAAASAIACDDRPPATEQRLRRTLCPPLPSPSILPKRRHDGRRSPISLIPFPMAIAMPLASAGRTFGADPARPEGKITPLRRPFGCSSAYCCPFCAAREQSGQTANGRRSLPPASAPSPAPFAPFWPCLSLGLLLLFTPLLGSAPPSLGPILRVLTPPPSLFRRPQGRVHVH